MGTPLKRSMRANYFKKGVTEMMTPSGSPYK